MKLSRAGLDFIKSFEGFVPYVYDDLRPPVNGKYREWKRGDPIKGTLTIGVGHTDAAKYKLGFLLRNTPDGFRLSEEMAMDILDVDLDECEDAVNNLVKVPLTQGQYDALVSFAYNCGVGNLKKLIVPLNKGDYKSCRAKFDLYVKSKGQYMRGLQRRRDGEQALWDSHPVILPDAPVDHPESVDAVKTPLGAGTAGTSGAAVGAVSGAAAATSAIPAPPQQITDAFTNAGMWKGMGESAVMFGTFAYERPFIVGAIVVTVLFLTFGLKYLPDSWRPA